jgi:hypothetical protein
VWLHPQPVCRELLRIVLAGVIVLSMIVPAVPIGQARVLSDNPRIPLSMLRAFLVLALHAIQSKHRVLLFGVFMACLRHERLHLRQLLVEVLPRVPVIQP